MMLIFSGIIRKRRETGVLRAGFVVRYFHSTWRVLQTHVASHKRKLWIFCEGKKEK